MKRKKNFLLQQSGGIDIIVPIGLEVVSLNGIITLNDTAVFLWQLLSEDRTFEELTEALVNEFDIDNISASRDVRAFINKTKELGLLEDEC